MTTPKFTPGPWHVGNGDVYAKGNRSSDFDDIVICGIGQSGGFRSHEYAVVKAHKPEGKANARLIAAAPELYGMVQELLKFLEPMRFTRTSDDDRAIVLDTEMRALLAKIDGADHA